VSEPLSSPASPPETDDAPSNFVRDIIDEDLEKDTHDGRVVTRFPPEPNGYLHIGHAKSIVLNFGIAEDYAARGADTTCRLRFDDTNPTGESEAYARSIEDAVHWLGYEPDEVRHASDYFERFYEYAVTLVEKGLAYVDSQSEEEIRENRGTVTEPGRESPYRDRSVDENLDLLRRMKAGEFADGAHVLRAKIDMASEHMIMRDPLLYRIRHIEHYRRGDDWCIYPMYDFAHCLEDAIENVTHSLCTLEFANNRRIYDWILENALPEDQLPQRPHQYEFNRLNLTYTVLSKRKLRRLIEDGAVDGWDDPRLFTLAGLRRRGVPPSAIRQFCRAVGVTRSPGRVQISRFEHAVRDDLNAKAPRVMAVLDPLRVVVENFAEATGLDEDDADRLEADYWPRDIAGREGTREVPFTRELFIERDDFREDPPEGFHRLAPGREVRLRHGFFLTCTGLEKDDAGNVTALRAEIDPETRSGHAPDGRNPDGTIHWVSATESLPCEARLYDRLFTHRAPDAGEEDFYEHLDPDALVTRPAARIEPSVPETLADKPKRPERTGGADRSSPRGGSALGVRPDRTGESALGAQRFQFERIGYFWPDPEDASTDRLVFNQIVPLRDSWAEEDTGLTAQELEKRRREKERERQKQRERAMAGQRDPVEDFGPEQRERFERFLEKHGLGRDDAAVLAERPALAEFFESVLGYYDAPQPVANWTINELLRELDDDAPAASLAALPFGADAFARLVQLTDEDAVSAQAARKVFSEMLAGAETDPEQIVEKRNLRRLDDAAKLRRTADEVVAEHPDEAARYRDGETKLLGFFMGRIMERTRGTADAQKARAALRDVLD
jgi:glutaminyl-tRNA synthetase